MLDMLLYIVNAICPPVMGKYPLYEGDCCDAGFDCTECPISGLGC